MRESLAECIDFKRLAKASIKLFVTATNVHSGRGHVFRNAELTPDVILASACLPTLFQAIEITCAIGSCPWKAARLSPLHLPSTSWRL